MRTTLKSGIALLVVFGVAVGVGYRTLKPEKSLPIIQPYTLNPALVDPGMWNDRNHRILDFKLVNHLGDTIRRKDVVGGVVIADFFFTRCSTICPVMSSNLQTVQSALKEETGWHILSHSVTPDADSVPVLNAYAKRHEADSSRWWFLTGAQTEIYKLARESYFACYDEVQGGGGIQDFVHTENIVLVDGLGRLRGFYDGTDELAVNQLIEDAKWLIGE